MSWRLGGPLTGGGANGYCVSTDITRGEEGEVRDSVEEGEVERWGMAPGGEEWLL